MGYAGHIQLDRGKFENDFAHYGIEILVKFRENMPLQKLDPFRQSGHFGLKFRVVDQKVDFRQLMPQCINISFYTFLRLAHKQQQADLV